MKTLSVEIERRQTLRFFVKVPVHWGRTQTRAMLTDPIIEDIAAQADAFDWDNADPDQFSIAGLYEITDGDDDDPIDYTFDDEPAPPHPDQLALIPAQEVAP